MDQTLNSPSATDPADGERRAVRGYSAQYRVAAELIYDALLDGTLEWVRLADPDAGRVDDIQIARPGRLDAYQIKWGEYEDRITFRDLVTATGSGGSTKPSPVAQLADGWRRLSGLHEGRRIAVHYATRASPSTSDNFRSDRVGGPWHLQAFLRHAFSKRRSWHQTDSTPPRSEWGEEIAAFEEAAKLPPPSLPAFLEACCLDLGWRFPEQGGTSTVAERRRSTDVEALAAYLFALVGSEITVVQIARDDLLKRLGWSGRFDLSFKHDFPVDERLYQPVDATVVELETAFSSIASGYIAVVGPPGSGKSTTLTQVLRYRAHVRVVRYYAYVRGDTAQDRGESHAFLHDLCLSLRSIAPPSHRRWDALPDTREELLEALASELAVLSEDWRTTGTHTIILVDGLDHIEREQSPIRSLLNDLPHPTTVPEGVLFVLGTQEGGLDAAAPSLRPIRAQLEEPGRKIVMAPLGRDAVRRIVAAVVPSAVLRAGDDETIYRLSAGHPLALNYLLKRLATMASEAETELVLAEAHQYGGDIEGEYAVYWETLRRHPEVIDLLALIARIRGAIELDTIDQLASEATVREFVRTARHFFNQETANRWSFFHNSFRQFLIRMTAQDPFGRADHARERGYHRRLADEAMRFPNSPLGWDGLFHLEKAGDLVEIARRFRQSDIRAHYFTGRQLEDIDGDIALAIRAAAKARDGIVLLRAVLLSRELHSRDQVLSEAGLTTLTLSLSATEDTAGMIFKAGTLAIGTAEALEFLPALLNRGDETLARRVFEAAEPLAELSGTRKLDADGRSAILDVWVRLAWRFRPLPQVLDAIGQVSVDPSEGVPPPYDEPDDATGRARIRLLQKLAQALLSAGNLDQVSDVEAALAKFGEEGRSALLTLDVFRVRAAIQKSIPVVEGRSALARIVAEIPPQTDQDADNLAIADLILRMGGDRALAETYVENASPLAPISELERDIGELGDASNVLRQARVMKMLNRPCDPVDLVPDSGDRDRGATLFHRMLALVGEVEGAALRGERWSAERVVQRLRPALTFFQRPWTETRDWYGWYRVEQRAASFFRALLTAANAHGPGPHAAVLDALSTDWAREGTREYPGWRLPLQLSIVRAAHALDGDKAWASEQLTRIEGSISVYEDASERAEHFASVAKAWQALGELECAERCRGKLLASSLGVGQEDDQMMTWFRWAERYLTSVGHDDVVNVLGPFLKGMPALYMARRGDDREEVLAGMIGAATTAEPSYGHEIREWLLGSEGVSWDAALSGSLRASWEADRESGVAAIVLCARLLVPFERSTNPDLLKTVLAAKEVAKEQSDETVDLAYDLLLRSVRTLTYSYPRRQWLEALQEDELPYTDRPIDETHGAIEDARFGRTSDETRRPGFELAGGQFVTQADALARTEDIEAFGDLLDRVAEEIHVSWDELLAQLLPGLTDPASLKDLCDRLERFSLKLADWLAVGERAAALGDRATVDRIRDRLLSISHPRGWHPRWDGGTRLTVARFLVENYADAGRQRAFELLASDIAETGIDARGLLSEFDTLTELLFPDLPTADVWAEIKQQVEELVEVKDGAQASLPPWPGQSRAHSDVLAELVDTALDSPVTALAAAARKAIVDLVNLGVLVSPLSARVTERLRGPEEERQIAALALLHTAMDAAIDWVATFAEDLTKLAWSTSAITRRIVHHILAGLEQPIPDGPENEALPAIYRLAFPPTPLPETSSLGDWYEPGQTMPDTRDPFELARLYLDPLKVVAEASGLSLEALTRRLYQLAQQIAPPDTWSQSAEERLMKHLTAIELKVPYRRPRSSVIRQAFGRVIAELIDAGALDAREPGVEEWLVEVDPVISSHDPVERPIWLRLPTKSEIGTFHTKEWCEAPSDSFRAMPTELDDGSVVVAEWTQIGWLDNGLPEEVRASMIAHKEWPVAPDEDLEHRFFYRRQTFCGSDYPLLTALKPMPVCVVKGGIIFDKPFLALNPNLGFALGWQPSNDGLFRWVDENGQTAAESIWWQDGNRLFADFRGGDEMTAEGWLVTASARGYPQMKAKFTHFARCCSVSRSMKSDAGNRATVLATERMPVP